MQLDLGKWPDRAAYFLGRWYDLKTELFISAVLNKGDVVVDVGANRGMFALAASRLVGDAGKVICFEPNPGCLSILDAHIELNMIKNIVVYPFALSDRETELVLHVPAVNSGEGSFGALSYDVAATYDISAHVEVGDRWLIDQAPSLVKIDVEGFEVNVLRGLRETIGTHHPIILTEVIEAHLSSCGASFDEILSLMADSDYVGFGVKVSKRDGGRGFQLVRLNFGHDDNACFNGDVVWLYRQTIENYCAFIE